MNLEWGPNWEDDLAGGHITGLQDPNVKKWKNRSRLNLKTSL